MKKCLKMRKGFTLIEMTIVLFIISLLVLIIVPNISRSREHAQEVHKDAMVSVVQSQIDAYLDDNTNRGSVSYNELQDGHYLTPDQVTKAENEHISIVSKDNTANKDSTGVKAVKDKDILNTKK